MFWERFRNKCNFLLPLCEDKWLTESRVLFLAEVPWAELKLALCSTISAGLLCDSKNFAPPYTNLYNPILNLKPFIFTIWKEQCGPHFPWLYLPFPLELNLTDVSTSLKINRPSAWCVVLVLRLAENSRGFRGWSGTTLWLITWWRRKLACLNAQHRDEEWRYLQLRVVFQNPKAHVA